jgi:hypothetical protein
MSDKSALLEATVRGVRRVDPKHQGKSVLDEATEVAVEIASESEDDATDTVFWEIEHGARRNYSHLGEQLAARNTALFRNGSNGHGLIHVLANGDQRFITKASQFAPLIVDTFTLKVMKKGEVHSELPQACHLNAMLNSEAFLKQFRPVDSVARTPLYLDDFSHVRPGYHDGGEGQRLLYVGPAPRIADSTETINCFLDVMAFASNADRTNTVAAALTILLRHRWPGEKPVVLVTANKSHAGKGTITDFIRGAVLKADILYENTDWPMQSQLQRQISDNPEIGMICLDNVRLDSAGGRARCIRSGFIESFVTNPEIILAAPGVGELARLKNSFVVTINSNDGSLSPDLMNRALSIHLEPKGDVQARITPIGNPKLDFLPQNQDRIEAELRGMIERWKDAGVPLDKSISHPMTPWARTVGGILKVSGFADFLANYGVRKASDDPIQEALGILAASKLGAQLTPMEWAKIAVEQGLVKTLIQTNERDTERGRERGIGVLLSRHLEETFEAVTDTERIHVRLNGGYRRWGGQNPHKRYYFEVLQRELLPVQEPCTENEFLSAGLKSHS